MIVIPRLRAISLLTTLRRFLAKTLDLDASVAIIVRLALLLLALPYPLLLRFLLPLQYPASEGNRQGANTQQESKAIISICSLAAQARKTSRLTA